MATGRLGAVRVVDSSQMSFLAGSGFSQGPVLLSISKLKQIFSFALGNPPSAQLSSLTALCPLGGWWMFQEGLSSLLSFLGHSQCRGDRKLPGNLCLHLLSA